MMTTTSLSALFAVLFVVAIAPDFNQDVTALSDDKKFGGQFTVTHLDPNGEVITTEQVDNLVNNEGMECVSDLLFNGTASCVGERTFSYLSVGTTATAPADGDTALIAESAGCARVGDATVALNVGTTGQRTATISSTFTGGSCEGEAYVEVGVFDTSVLANGNMLARATFASITLSTGDSLQIDYDIVINNT